MLLRNRSSAGSTTLFPGLALAAAASIAAISGAQQPAEETGGGFNDTAIHLAFRGGPATAYVDAVRESTGDQLNALVMPEVRHVELPPIELTNVTVSSAIELLDHRVSADGVYAIDVNVIRDDNGAPIFAIHAIRMKNDPFASSAETSTRVWNVAPVLESGRNADEVLSAVEAALELAGHGHGDASVRFHEGTGLIMADGPVTMLGVIEDVVSRLGEESDRLQSRRSDLQQWQARWSEANEFAATLRQKLEEQQKLAQQWLIETEMLKARLAAIENENERMSQRLMAAQDEVDRWRRQSDQLERHIADLTERLQRREEAESDGGG